MNRKLRKSWLAFGTVIALCAAVLLWPVPFARYANTAEVEYMTLLSWESGTATSRSRSDLTPEEMGQVLSLLEGGRRRWQGFCRNIVYSGGEALYSFTLSHSGNGRPDARFELLGDGTLYNVWYNVGYTCFRLENVDMEALCRELDGLLTAKTE